MYFLEWKLDNYDSNVIEICSNESNWKYASIGSGNCLAPKRRQAIIWTNAEPIHWRIYVAQGGGGGLTPIERRFIATEDFRC